MENIFNAVEKNINNLVDGGVYWSAAFSDEEIRKARDGQVNLQLVRFKELPKDWLPVKLSGLKVLSLAGSGGQQAPVLAAAGAEVTVLDLSEKMLEMDRYMAKRHNLEIDIIHGNMCDMNMLSDGVFDIIINPPSLMYVPEVSAVYKECFRVLKKGGTFIFAAPAPVNYLCDFIEEGEGGYYKACNKIPYKSYEHSDQGDWVEFGHTMEEYIGGLISQGFAISGYLEEQCEDITELTFVIKADKPL